MKTTNLDVQHAFPIPEKWNDSGMTLRDYFAAAALQGWLSTYDGHASHPVESNQGYEDKIAEYSYKQADAMLKAREK